MLVLNPSSVSFAGTVWPGVTLVTISRAAQKQVTEWSDAGPHVVLADVPEQVVKLRVEAELKEGDANGPAPGASGTLSVTTSPNASDAGKRVISATVVVAAVSYEVSAKRGAVRTVELVAISSDGATDPIRVADG